MKIDAAPPDWTIGPPKWAAVVVMAAFAAVSLLWSLASGRTGDVIAGSDGDRGIVAGAPLLTKTIDLNTATGAELELLPGIGPGLAQRIIDDRAARGPFASVEDLSRVRGIGPRLMERMRPMARVSSPPDGESSPPPRPIP